MLVPSGALLEKLHSAKKIVFFTGAGISAESGIPTFCGEDGIWNKFKPEELASFNAFIKNPKLVWEWYQFRREHVRTALPNAGHIAIADFQKYFEVTVVTQNVDNLHRKAGSKNIYELHGNIEKNFCIDCKRRYDFIEFPKIDSSPKCECGGLIRPDVVWFGEMLPADEYAQSERAARECDILFSVGTSSIVFPAAYIPYEAADAGKYVVEINPEETELSRVANEAYRGKSGEVLNIILTEFLKHLN